MKVLRVVIITIVVMVLISCATTPKAQNVEIDRTALAHELIAEGLALLVAEHAECADKLMTETETRTAEVLARLIGREAETRFTELFARVNELGAMVVETERTERLFQVKNLNEEQIDNIISKGFNLVPTDDPNVFNVLFPDNISECK